MERSATVTPPLVTRAMTLAEQMRFEHSSRPEVGRLLRVLAGQLCAGVAGEIGTGCGVGAAWLASALRPEASLVTVELDAERAEAARTLFEPYRNVTVLTGDWHEILPYGPFALLFADGGRAKELEPETVLEALEPGGLVLLDDLTPMDRWPAESPKRASPAGYPGWPDPVREFWLKDARLAATELPVTPAMSVILASRL